MWRRCHFAALVDISRVERPVILALFGVFHRLQRLSTQSVRAADGLRPEQILLPPHVVGQIHQPDLHHRHCCAAISPGDPVMGMRRAMVSALDCAQTAGLCCRQAAAIAPPGLVHGCGRGVAMLGMMVSCAPGVTVVNIDNGFGAAVAASLINRKR